MPPPSEDKRSVAFRFSPRSIERLGGIAERWHCDKTSILEHAVELLADPGLAASVGGGFMAAEQALRCWAELLDQAAADNARTFVRAEWNLLADANNGCSPLLTLAGDRDAPRLATTLLWANAADSMKLDGSDEKWGLRDPAGFVERLRQLDYTHSWAALVAVQWFWEHSRCAIDHGEDAWWTPEFRAAHACGGRE